MLEQVGSRQRRGSAEDGEAAKRRRAAAGRAGPRSRLCRPRIRQDGPAVQPARLRRGHPTEHHLCSMNSSHSIVYFALRRFCQLVRLLAGSAEKNRLHWTPSEYSH